MLKNNTIRFGTDGFAFKRQSLLTAKQPFDTTGQTAIEGFTVTGTEPSGTRRRFLMRVDDKLYRFSAGNPVEYTGAGTFDDIIEGGNTAAELVAVDSIPTWLGKKIYVVIALEAPADAAASCRLKDAEGNVLQSHAV